MYIIGLIVLLGCIIVMGLYVMMESSPQNVNNTLEPAIENHVYENTGPIFTESEVLSFVFPFLVLAVIIVTSIAYIHKKRLG